MSQDASTLLAPFFDTAMLGEFAQHVQANFPIASKKCQIELRRELVENGYGAELGKLVVQIAVNP